MERANEDAAPECGSRVKITMRCMTEMEGRGQDLSQSRTFLSRCFVHLERSTGSSLCGAEDSSTYDSGAEFAWTRDGNIDKLLIFVGDSEVLPLHAFFCFHWAITLTIVFPLMPMLMMMSCVLHPALLHLRAGDFFS